MPPSPLRFEPKEALRVDVARNLPATLQVSTRPIYYKSLILRLLTGTIDIECKKTNQIIEQRNNYSTLVYTQNTRAYKRSLTSAIPCNLEKYNQHIRSTVTKNFSFYRDIYFEFCGYFFFKENENEIGAFVHLYRALEKMAYCLPLMWAARAKEYKDTFEVLKNYFNDPKTGELKVLKRFITDFIDVTERQVQVSLNIYSIHPDWQKRYYNVLHKILNDWNALVSYAPYSQLVIRFETLLDLIITIRNKYFHALTGQAHSFDSEEILDPNEFFAILNESSLNWLSFLLFQVFEIELERI